jgi:2-desacetyl-2-hydroxyethyl bacteriochlorophyllide A dehydrogenase
MSTAVMKALVVTAPNEYSVVEVPRPIPQPGEALVKVSSCAICGSDVTIIRGEMEDIRFPLIPGHEWAGHVVSGQGLPDLEERPVVSNLLQSCRRCGWCDDELPNLCRDLTEPGISVNGAYAEYLVVRARDIIALPHDLPVSRACMVEPLAVALYAVSRVPVSPRNRVIIFGAGGIGQLLLQVCLLRGAETVVVVDHHDARLAVARALGATAVVNSSCEEVAARFCDDAMQRPDTGFEACGNPEAFCQLLDIIEPAGRIGLVGYSGTKRATFEPSIIMRKMLDIRGVLSPTGTWDKAIELLRSGRVHVESILTHRFPLSEFPSAFELAANRSDGAIRVVTQP